ncbi:MAG: tetratricopeptide repeat protein [Chitinophagaceae bacterium]|nr:tetratricopeptide repeat protein [Chitinophagaceae bacterium]
MSETKQTSELNQEVIIEKAKDFWTRHKKIITIASLAIIVVAGGWYIYRHYFILPKEIKAQEALFRAEEYYRKDSVMKALNGDGQNPGFLKIIDRYKGTKAANLANFYAGSCYIKLNENEKAIRYLKKFSSASKPAKAHALKLMADAYGDLGKTKEALEYYKKASNAFEKDENFASECLFMAAYLAHKSMNDKNTAIALYKELKKRFPRSSYSYDADKYLAMLGVYNTD